jgi:hypothetical protein
MKTTRPSIISTCGPEEVAAVRLMNLTWMGFGDMLEGRMWLPPGPDT